MTVACLSGVAIDACSNVIAQRLKAWNESTPFAFNRALFCQFVVLAIVAAPLNYAWQNWLERAFPGWKTIEVIQDAGIGEEEKGFLTEDGEDKRVVRAELRVRDWMNIFKKWFSDVRAARLVCEMFGRVS